VSVSEPSLDIPPPVPPGSVPPVPTFTVMGATTIPHAAAPTLRFEFEVSDTTGRDIYAIALTAQVMIEPAKRRYDDETRVKLEELFGTPERWGATTHSFLWAQVGAVVTNFRDSVRFPIDVACTYDLELAATKYFHSLPDGQVPLAFHFTGTILYAGEQDHLQVARVPWSCSANWNMPIDAWRDMMAAYYPGGGWVRLDRETLERLHGYRSAGQHPSFDAAVVNLLDGSE
jgi:hypothetical protein